MQKHKKQRQVKQRQVKSRTDKTCQAKASQVKTEQIKSNAPVCSPPCREPNGLCTIVPKTKRFAHHCARDLTRNMETPRAMPEAQSTLNKKVGAEPNNKTHTVMKYQNQKDGNVHMTQTTPSVGNRGLITQDWKVHEPVLKTQQGKQNSVSKSKTQPGKENYIASQYRLIDPWTPLVGEPPFHLEQVKPGYSQYRRSAGPKQTSQNKLSLGAS